MPSVEESIVIPAPPGEVFDYLEDPANYASYQGTVLHAELDGEGPVRVGSRISGANRILGRVFDWTVEVIEHERPSKIVCRTVGGEMRLAFCNSLVPEGDATRLTYRVDADLALDGLFGGTIKSLVEDGYRQQMRADLAALADVFTARD